MCHKKFYAVFVIVAQHVHEISRLVVLASEREHEHSACIRVQHEVAQHFACVLVVVRELRAAIVVMPGMYGVDAFELCLFLQSLGKAFCNAVDASYGRHNPYLVSYAHVAVLAFVAFECTVFGGYCKFLVNGCVAVFQFA